MIPTRYQCNNKYRGLSSIIYDNAIDQYIAEVSHSNDHPNKKIVVRFPLERKSLRNLSPYNRMAKYSTVYFI